MGESSATRAPLRLAVLISGGGTSLANLIDRVRDGRLSGVEIVAVVSSRSAVGGVAIAEQAGIPVRVIPRSAAPDAASLSTAIGDVCDRVRAELVVMAGFLRLWRIPGAYRDRVLNMHPALLPRFGGRGMYGLRVHEAVLAAGEHESGCTVHVADDEYDHGPIVAQRRVPVRLDDTPESLAARVMAAERELYPEVIQSVASDGLAALKRWIARSAALEQRVRS